MTTITAVRSAFPAHRYAQAEFTSKVAELADLGPAQRAQLERLHGNAGVDYRHIVLPLPEYGGLRATGLANDRYVGEAGRSRGAGAPQSLGGGRGGRPRSGPADRHVSDRRDRALPGRPAHPPARAAARRSSASVLHVLEKAMSADPPPGSPGLMIGLGPGVSIELVLLRW